MESTLLFILTFAIGTISVIVLFYRRLNFWVRKGVIPHLTPLPLIGNIFPVFILRKTPINDYFHHLYNLFPEARYFGMMDFNTPVVVLRDPELIKDVCVKVFDNFPDHKSLFNENVDPVLGKNLFALQGNRWKEMRTTLSPSFTASKMEVMFQLISKCSLNFVNYFLNHPEESMSVEMKDAFMRYTNDVIATSAFGINVDSMKNKNNEFYMRGKDSTEIFKGFRTLKIFIFRLWPKIMHLLGQQLLPQETNRFFKSIIENTVKVREEQDIVRPDMIQLLTEARDNEKGIELTIDDIVAQGFVFFLAGLAPTGALMGFVAHELAMNPEIQEKLRNEVDTLTRNEGSDISYETLLKMKYMDMVISETLRKYPPFAVMDRLCAKRYTLPKSTPESKEYTAEPNSLIWLPIHALHHDPKYFPDPEKFDPERFNDENKDRINPYAYIPFGVGPRKCIGKRFALMETKILFVHILQKFTLEKHEKMKHPIEFEKSLNVVANGDFWIKLQKRLF